jgi:prepilin-type processing-associated H-X9-DG protein
MTAFGENSRSAYPDLPDGASHTLLLLEACGRRIVWTEPRDIDVASVETGINRAGSSPGQSDGLISSFHAGGAHVALADGAVRWVNESIDPTVLKALVTANGGEPEREF